MFSGHAPPFGWYWSASRSRASAPRPSASCVTSPVAPGWFVDSSPRSSASRSSGRRRRGRRCRRRARARRSARASRARALELVQRRVREHGDAPSLDRVAQRLRDRVPCAVADLEQPLARRAAAAREPVAAVLARELHAELLEPVDRRRRLGGEHLDELACPRSRASSARRPRRAARASRPRRRRPGSRPAPSRSCTTGASPSSRARPGRRPGRRTRRRRGPRPRFRSRARRMQALWPRPRNCTRL